MYQTGYYRMKNFLLTYSAIDNEGFSNCLYLLSDKNIDISEIENYQESIVLIPYNFKEIIEPKCFTKSNNTDYVFPKIFPVTKKMNFLKIEELKNYFIQNTYPEQLDKEIYFEQIEYEEYEKIFFKVQGYLKRGDIYEINYCIPFVYKNIAIHPEKLFFDLINKMNAPFTAFFKMNDEYILSFSPERFLKKINDTLFTEPIKGTAPRGRNNSEDEQFKNSLLSSIKEKTENAMIADVCRNDLSQIAQKSTVHAEELYSIKTYATVHQMVSKISCKIKPGTSFKDIIYATFPMASMTGAPKIRAMQIADEIEKYPRNYYSGCLGLYENGNFDLSVLIRSIFYNTTKKELKIWAGSAITIYANPQDEYNECLLKARKIIQTIENYIPKIKNMT